MNETSLSAGSPGKAVSWMSGWWQIVHSGALLGAMVVSPATYTPENRHATATQICRTAGLMLPWFVLLSALLSLVLIHIVVVTAQSYGLSHFALGMVVRVLVVELLPLSAALFVALRAGMASHSEFAAIRRQTAAAPLAVAGIGPIHPAFLPRIVANAVAVISLVAISGVLALVLAYVGVYGVTPSELGSFTRTVGQVFEPVVILSLGLKTLLFAGAVATIPAAASLQRTPDQHNASLAMLQGTARLFVVLIAIEVLLLITEFF